jgi:hypothetical protein
MPLTRLFSKLSYLWLFWSDCPVPRLGAIVPSLIEVSDKKVLIDLHVDPDIVDPVAGDIFDDANGTFSLGSRRTPCLHP